MQYQTQMVQAIAKQRHAERIAAAERYRLARMARETRAAAGTRGAARVLVRRFRRRYAT
jgi:hypothetical protein